MAIEREKWEKTREQRKQMMKRMIDELRGKKNELIEKRDALKQEYRIMLDNDPNKDKKLNEIKLVEQELRSDYIKALEERGEEVDSAVPSSKLKTDVINHEFKEQMKEVEARIEENHRNQEEATATLLSEFPDPERRLREKEIEMEQVIQEEYRQREAGSAASVIPAAIRKKNYEAGAVSATDSESEAEFQQKLRGNRTKAAFKWTPKHEHELEELLIKHSFDFKAATRDFLRLINSLDDAKYYEMDTKTLQLRWTDIEIRKYRLNNAASSNVEFAEEEDNLDDLDDGDLGQGDWSALAPSQDSTHSKTDRSESPSTGTAQAIPGGASASQAPQVSREELMRREQEYQQESKDRVQTNLFGYSDGSSSEDNQIDSSSRRGLAAQEPSSPTARYNDLEELD